jgi:small conductance mechanosensitive channel
MKTLTTLLLISPLALFTPAAQAQAPTLSPTAGTQAAHAVEQSAAKAEAWMEAAIHYTVQWLPSVLGAMIVLILSLIIGGWVRKVILSGLTRAKLDSTLARFIANMARWAVLFLGFMAAAGTFGINITGFAAILGAIGLAISLGFQGTLSNLASGILLLVFRPFKVGDSIVAAGQAGTVDAIDLFTTTLDTPDNRRIIVPNGAIFGGTIENVTFHDRRKIDVKVPVAGDADVEVVRSTLLAAATSIASVAGSISEPPPAVAFVELTPPTWNVSVWCRTSLMGGVRESLLLAIKRGVETAGVGAKPAAPVVVVKG